MPVNNPSNRFKITTVAGTTYTVLSDDEHLLFTSNSAVTLTINTDQAVAGREFRVEQNGTGQVTFAGTATRVNSDSHTKTYGQNSCVIFQCSVDGTFNFYGRTA